MTEQQFVADLEQALRQGGITEPVLTRSVYEEEHFGNAQVEWHIGSLKIEITRERMKYFIRLGARGDFGLHDFGDVAVAMGWQSIDKLMAVSEPEPLDATIATIAQHMVELESRFSPDRRAHTELHIDRVAQERTRRTLRALQDVRRLSQ